MVSDRTSGFRAPLLALGVGFWAGLQTVAPILALFRAKSAVAALGSDPGALAAGFGATFLASANPVQLVLWLLAGPLYALAALSLAGVRLGPAREYYGVALLLEGVVWATFQREFAYILLPGPARWAVSGLGALLFFGYVLVILAEAKGRSRIEGKDLERRHD